MTSLLKSVFGVGGMKRNPSFDDLSMGASHDAEQEYKEHKDVPSIVTAPKEQLTSMGSSPTRHDVWQGVFNPRRNFSPKMKNLGNQYYDHVPDKTGEYTVWDHVVKGERMRIFLQFDKDNDGYINANDLELSLGRGADVQQMIAAADKNGDGKIDYSEFCEMLRNS